MYFTPTSADEIAEIKQAKSNGIALLSGNFFTYAFALLVSILPVISVWIILKLAFYFSSLPFIVYPVVFSVTALAFKGYYRFCVEFNTNKKRDFGILSVGYTKKPMGFTVKTFVSAIQIFFPCLLFCMLPLAFDFSRGASLVCEILSIFLGIVGIALFLSRTVFKTFDGKYVKFCSTFYLQIFLCIITSGFWLMFAVPYFILSAINFH